MTNAGHISYVELDGDTCKNLEAFESVIRCMKEAGIGYGSINHPVDRDPCCGYNGIIDNECPKCHRTEEEGPKFERIRRITGYLVGTTDRWNNAKRAEEKRPCKTWTINNKNNKKGSDICSDILNLLTPFKMGKKRGIVMEDTLRISGIIDESIVDGKGLRYTIFTQGCPHHCEGCHNPDTHDFEGGTEKEITAIYEEICSNPLLSGVTFSGGEPFVNLPL